jgi:clan AA aspartic protease
MPYSYNPQFIFPFPQLPIVICNIDSNSSTLEMEALIDTGADGTLIPKARLDAIQAEELHVTRIRSHWGEWRTVVVYVVDLEIAGEKLPAVEVIADEHSDTVLLGRNVLNRLILLLDGPGQQSEVLIRRPLRL